MVAAPPTQTEPPPDTLQLCAGRRCLVFQIGRRRVRVPAALRRFLADARVTFAGRDVVDGCRRLRGHCGLAVASALEICRPGVSSTSVSVEEMARRMLGLRGLTVSGKVAVSNWDVSTLSRKQVRYACVDAYLCCHLGIRLRRRRRALPYVW